MGRSPCCNVEGVRKGAWTKEEDLKLFAYISDHGEGAWRSLPQQAGLMRCGKSCRLRWANYLNPGIKRGEFSKEEEQIIIRLHASLGNKWSTIAKHLPRRTDNEIKNHWNTKLKKCVDNVPDLIAPDNNGHNGNEIIISPEPLIVIPRPKLLNVVAAKVNASGTVAQLVGQRIATSTSSDGVISASSGSSNNNESSTSVSELISDHCTAFESSPRSPRPISTAARLLNRMATRLSLSNRPNNNLLLGALQSSVNINNPRDYSTESKLAESEPISPNLAFMECGRFGGDDYTGFEVEFGSSMDDLKLCEFIGSNDDWDNINECIFFDKLYDI